MSAPHTEAPAFDVDAVLDSASVIVCCGSGGVGKTTTAASLALRAAERGRRTCVLTIDPARRLAQSMGLEELDNTPRPVSGVDDARGGSLDAMMLDMKRTFDEIVASHSDEGRAEEIFDNPFYQSLSSSFSGTQEYMAMEKLGQLRAETAYDLIVVDTPPTRSALDFLDAPQRLGSFLDGRMIRILTAPARVGGRAYLKVLTGGVSVVTSVISRIVGAQALGDLQMFVASLDSLFGGFRQRAEVTYALLKEPGTAFVVVATPERDALREAAFFVERLSDEQMPLAGLVVNRVHKSAAPSLSPERAREAADSLAPRAGDDGDEGAAVAAGVLRVHADRAARAEREERLEGDFTRAHPEVAVAQVSARAGDVHSLDDLRRVGDELARDEPVAVPG